MKDLASQAKCTMFAVTLAQVFVALRTLTGQSDLTLGFVSANRNPGNRSVVALVADTAFVRAQGGTRLDAAYVSYVWASLRAALEHAQTPRTLISEVTGIGMPIVMLNFIAVPAPVTKGRSPQAASGATLSALQQAISDVFSEKTKTMPQLLYAEFRDTGQELHAECYFNPRYFNEQDCRDLCGFT
jgi:hypothetical protein